MKHFVPRILLPLCGLGAALIAQTSTLEIGKIAFEVASIRPAQRQPMNQGRTGMTADAGMLRYTNVSLKGLHPRCIPRKGLPGGGAGVDW